MTTRTMVVVTPHWPLVAAGVTPEVPAVVVKANRVVAASPAAQQHQVGVGMRRRESQSRCPALEVIEHDPDRDARRFEAVVAALETFTPRVEILGPGRCSFPTRGPSRYFGGDAALARSIVDTVDDEIAHTFGSDHSKGGDSATGSLRTCPPGFGACVGVGDGLFAAALAAEMSAEATTTQIRLSSERIVVVEPGSSAAFLAPISVSALWRWSAPLDDGEHLVDLFWRLGLRTLGSVAALPAADLLARFGTDGEQAHRLASGFDERPPDTRPVPPESWIETELDPPADRVDRASFVAKTMADQMHAALSRDGLACTRVVIEAVTETGETLSRVWRHEGALSATDVADRMRWQLDGWLTSRRRPTSGVAILRLIPDEVIPDVGRQLGFWGGQSHETERAARALARVQGLLGPDAVSVPERRGGRALGAAVGRVPLPFVDITEPDRTIEAPGADAPWPGRLPSPSPATLNNGSGGEVEVFDVDRRPVVVSGRGELSGEPSWLVRSTGLAEPIVAWAGPWPLDERWWDPEGHLRAARLQIVLDGGSAHVVSLAGGEWKVEATYD